MPDRRSLEREKLLNELSSSLSPSAGGGHEAPAPLFIPDHELIRRVGRGSYGEDWLARNVMGQWRAVKIVYRGAFDHDRPFERELEGIRRFEPVSRSHPSQLHVLHVGRNEAAGCFYYVMELADPVQATVHGAGDSEAAIPPAGNEAVATELSPELYEPRTLRSELFARKRLTLEECLQIGSALATALDHLHRHGLVHRDIKPSNIIFIGGIPKLADIGLVAAAEDTLSFVGTEGYLPPEGPGTPQADIYSLGKVLYEMATGHDRQDYPELPTELVANEASEATDLLELNEVIVRACHADPKQRYATAAELHADLALLQTGKSLSRIRTIERRLHFLQRAGVLVSIVAALVGGLYLWQARQTRAMRALADAKGRLATDNGRLARRDHARLLQIQTGNGIQAMDSGDLPAAALWFAEALESAEGDPAAERRQRFRLGALFQQMARPVAVLSMDFDVATGRMTSDRSLIFGGAGGDKLGRSGGTAELRVWDAADYTLKLSQPITGPWGFVSTSGRWRIVSEQGQTKIWDVFGGNLIIGGLDLDVTAATVALDGSKIALADRKTKAVRVYELPSGRPISRSMVHSNEVSTLACDPAMRWLVSGTGVPREEAEGHMSRGKVRFWNARTGEPITDWIEEPYPVDRKPVFDHQGAAVAIFPSAAISRSAGIFPGRAQVYDLPLGKRRFELHQPEVVASVAFSPDDRYLATGSVGEVRLWDAQTGELIHPAWPVPFPIDHVEFSPDGSWLTAGGGDDVRIWDVRSGELVGYPLRQQSCRPEPGFLREGRRLITSQLGGKIQVWDLSPFIAGAALFDSAHDQGSRWVGFSPRNLDLAVVGAFGQVRIWNPEQILPLGASLGLPAQTNGIMWLDPGPAWSPDGALLAVPTHGLEVRIWDWNRRTEHIPPLPHAGARVCEFSPDGKLLATCGTDQAARLWQVSNGTCLAVLPHTNRVVQARFSPDGHRLVTVSGPIVRFWDIPTGKAVAPALDYGSEVTAVEFSPDGTRLAVGTPLGSARIYEVVSGRQLVPTLQHARTAYYIKFCLHFSPDGRRLVTGGDDDTGRIWDTTTGKLLTPPLVHKDAVGTCAFSPDGERVVTGSLDGTARIWDAATGEPLSPPLKQGKPVLGVSLRRDGQRLATVGIDGARVWKVPLWSGSWHEAQAEAQLCSGRRIGNGERIEPLTTELFESAWQIVSKTQPTSEEQSTLIWHRSRLAQARLLRNWDAAEFHARSLVEMLPKDASAEAALADIERLRPPRPADAPPGAIDLSHFYNASLSESWFGVGNDLAEVPQRIQSFVGTTFDVRGLIQVGSDPRVPFPERVSGIHLHRKVARLQFLHAQGEMLPTGTVVGHYLIRFADGRSEGVPLRYNENISDWWEHPELPHSLPGAVVAWHGYNAASRAQGITIRLFKFTWTNPTPDAEVASIDFVADEGSAFLVAVTAE